MEGSWFDLSAGCVEGSDPGTDFVSSAVAVQRRALRDDAHDCRDAADRLQFSTAALFEVIARNEEGCGAAAQAPPDGGGGGLASEAKDRAYVARTLDGSGDPRPCAYEPSAAGVLAMDAGRRLVALIGHLEDPQEQAEVLRCLVNAAEGGLMQHGMDTVARARREQGIAEDAAGYACIDPDAVAADIMAVEHRMSVYQASRKLHRVQDIHHRLPRVWNRIMRGELAVWVASIIADETMHVVDPEKIAEIERQILELLDTGRGTGQWSGYLTRQLRLIVGSVDPDAQREREEQQRASRGLRRGQLESGMERVEATLEAVDAEAVMAAVEELAARWARNPNDDRDAEARRADALVQLTTGIDKRPLPHPDAEPDELVRVPIRPHVTVVADVGHTGFGPRVWVGGGSTALDRIGALLGQSDATSVETVPVRCADEDPDLAAARAVLERLAERLRRETTYRPDAALRAAVVERDGTCRHPGCTVHAARCDLDHVVPFNAADPLGGGPTREDNLISLCRRHHRLKTHGNAEYRLLADGRVEVRIGDDCVAESWPQGHRGDMRDHLGLAYEQPRLPEYRARWAQIAEVAEALAAHVRAVEIGEGPVGETEGPGETIETYWSRRARDTARYRAEQSVRRAQRLEEMNSWRTHDDPPPF